MIVELDNEAKVAIELTQELMKRLFPDILDSREVDSIFGYTIGEMITVVRSAQARMELL
jgi:hypothetical protein